MACAYLILSSQASARSRIVENTASALTSQKAFLNNFEKAYFSIFRNGFRKIVSQSLVELHRQAE